MDTRRINLANQYAELQRLRRELYLMEEKLRVPSVEAVTTRATVMVRGSGAKIAAPHVSKTPINRPFER